MAAIPNPTNRTALWVKVSTAYTGGFLIALSDIGIERSLCFLLTDWNGISKRPFLFPPNLVISRLFNLLLFSYNTRSESGTAFRRAKSFAQRCAKYRFVFTRP
jgi:hypothetical protein